MKACDQKTGKAQAKQAVRKHETAMHPGKPKTAFKTGGVVARGAGAAVKGTRFSKDG